MTSQNIKELCRQEEGIQNIIFTATTMRSFLQNNNFKVLQASLNDVITSKKGIYLIFGRLHKNFSGYKIRECKKNKFYGLTGINDVHHSVVVIDQNLYCQNLVSDKDTLFSIPAKLALHPNVYNATVLYGLLI